MRNRIFNLIVGAPRSGKSHYAEKLMTDYSGRGGAAIIYNQGKPSDFSTFDFLEVPGAVDYAAGLEKEKRRAFLHNPHLPFFVREDGERTNKKAVLKSGAKYRIYRATEPKMEAAFFKYLYDYCHDCIITFDDARPITRQGLSPALIQLFSRQNHAGRKTKATGVDLQAIYHNLDTVSDELLDYVTHLTLFRVNMMPERFGNIALYKVVQQCVNELNKLPKYSYFTINMQTLHVTKKLQK